MASRIGNLVKQTTTSTGTGALTLTAPDSGFQSFSSNFGTGVTTNTFYYFISNTVAVEWEIGTGHMSDATTLVRDTILLSSNSNLAVNFSAGLKNVVNDLPQQQQAALEQLGWNAGTGTLTLSSSTKLDINNNAVVNVPNGSNAGDAANYGQISGLGGTGLTFSTGKLNVNTSQNISTLSNLTSNGVVTTSGGTGALSVTAISGSGSIAGTTSPVFTTPNIGTATGNITGNAATVTTNANLTGVITSVGNATSVASQTGTGTKFVMDTSPTLITPDLGTPASGNLTNCTGFPNTYNAATAIASNADWNTLTTAGLFYTTGTSYSHAPFMSLDNTGILKVYTNQGTYPLFQEWTHGVSGDTWKRSYNGTIWTFWKIVGDINYRNGFQIASQPVPVGAATVATSGTYIGNGMKAVFSGTSALVFQYPTNSAVSDSQEYPSTTLNTGTTTTGSASIEFPLITATLVSRRIEARVSLKAVSNGTDRYNFLFGQVVTRTTNGTYGFSYTDNENSGKWVCFYRDTGGTDHLVNTNIAPIFYAFSGLVPDLIQRLGIEYDYNNSTAYFYIDNSLVGTLSSVGQDSGITLKAKINKSLGTTAAEAGVALSLMQDLK